MKRRTVSFSPAALDDLRRLGDWIAERAGVDVASHYIERIEAYCDDLAYSGERGRLREDLRPGLRIIGFERRVAIAFTVSDDEVLILRVYYGGRNWTAAPN
ncbi:MAG: type II toxin-antitoxin system RelE/ParE family toxin [Enhydrobacter sp.]|nr:MAG: type II toxin-antitoxin system RelE/ParE family toxin [Enhydrobacter sp.]